MAFAVADFHDLIELLEKHPEWRADLRRLVLTEDILALPQIVQQLAQTVAELAEAQKRTEARVEELAEAQKRTEARVEELAEAQRRTEEVVRKLADRQSSLVGDQLERRYRERAFAYFGRILRQVQVVSLQELQADLEGRLSEAELEDLLLLDVLVRGQAAGQPDAPQVWLALEVSAIVDRNDVKRALERAALLRKAGYVAIPAVAGEEVTSGGQEAARSQAVLLLQDGRRWFWEEALVRALSGA